MFHTIRDRWSFWLGKMDQRKKNNSIWWWHVFGLRGSIIWQSFVGTLMCSFYSPRERELFCEIEDFLLLPLLEWNEFNCWRLCWAREIAHICFFRCREVRRRRRFFVCDVGLNAFCGYTAMKLFLKRTCFAVFFFDNMPKTTRENLFLLCNEKTVDYISRFGERIVADDDDYDESQKHLKQFFFFSCCLFFAIAPSSFNLESLSLSFLFITREWRLHNFFLSCVIRLGAERESGVVNLSEIIFSWFFDSTNLFLKKL